MTYHNNPRTRTLLSWTPAPETMHEGERAALRVMEILTGHEKFVLIQHRSDDDSPTPTVTTGVYLKVSEYGVVYLGRARDNENDYYLAISTNHGLIVHHYGPKSAEKNFALNIKEGDVIEILEGRWRSGRFMPNGNYHLYVPQN